MEQTPSEQTRRQFATEDRGAGIIRAEQFEKVDELLPGVVVALHDFEKFVQPGLDLFVAGEKSATADKSGDPARVRGFGDPGKKFQGFGSPLLTGKKFGEIDDRTFVVRFEFERRSQRDLVADFPQTFYLRRFARAAQRGDELPHLRLRLRPHERGNNLSLIEGEDRRDALNFESTGNRRILVDVDLDENNLTGGLVDHRLENRSQRCARTAPRRPEVDHHRRRHRPLEDVGFECFVCHVDSHGGKDTGLCQPMRPPGGTGSVHAVSRQGEPVGESETVSGVDVENVTGWMRERVPSLATPLHFDLITGGLSNISYRVTDANGTRWVLRRPPLGHVLATAHDMSREFKIIDALAATNVPVPPLVGLCTDDSVNGAPFYVMDFVDGVIARDRPSAESLLPEARRRAGESLVEVLAAIHAVDIDACGLGDLGRREAYVERQISRWTRQWEATRDSDVPVMEELSARLAAAIPEQGPATIVHGDYRLDNCILDSDGTVSSVLDWELCTLGNPLADVGLMLVYWVESGDSIRAGLPDGTTADGFATRAELLTRYSEITGRDVGNIGYFIALGYWKLACILQGVMVRYRAGAMVSETVGSDPSLDDMFTDQVVALGRAGLEALDGELGSSHG